MRRAQDYIASALRVARSCTSIPQAMETGSGFGKTVAAEVMAAEAETGQVRGTYRLNLEDAFQHALNHAKAQSTIQAFLDAALSTLTDELRGQAP